MRLEDPRRPTGVSPIQVVSYQLILKSTSDELVYAVTFAAGSILSLHASCNELSSYSYYAFVGIFFRQDLSKGIGNGIIIRGIFLMSVS